MPTKDTPFLNARTDTYALLAALLNRAPGPDLLRQLQGAELHPNLPESLIVPWIEVRMAAQACSPSAFEKEFQAIFVGLGQGEVVPYASWYREKRLMAWPLARLRRDLAQMGIVHRSNLHEAEDHAALLLETMALLASRRSMPVRIYAGFFEEHIASWMFDFLTDVQKAPSARFYSAVAVMGIAWLYIEKIYLDAQCAANVH